MVAIAAAEREGAHRRVEARLQQEDRISPSRKLTDADRVLIDEILTALNRTTDEQMWIAQAAISEWYDSTDFDWHGDDQDRPTVHAAPRSGEGLPTCTVTVSIRAGRDELYGPGAFDHQIGRTVLVSSGDLRADGVIAQATLRKATVAVDGQSAELTLDVPRDFPTDRPAEVIGLGGR